MTCTPNRDPMTALWAPWMQMYQQQMQLMQALGQMMLDANPWLVMLQAGMVNPLSADAGLSRGDSPEDIVLDTLVAGGEAGPDDDRPVTEVVAAAPEMPKPAAKAKEPGRSRSAAGTKPAATRIARTTGKTRARRRPAALPTMPEPGPEKGPKS